MKYVRTPENQASLGTVQAKLQAIFLENRPRKFAFFEHQLCNATVGSETIHPWHILTLCFHFGFKVYSTPYLQQTQSCQNLCQQCSSDGICCLENIVLQQQNMVDWPFPRCAHQNPVASSDHRIMVTDFRYTPSSVHRSFPFRGTSDSFHLKVWTSHHISIIASTHGGSSRCVSSACFGTFFLGGMGVGNNINNTMAKPAFRGLIPKNGCG